MSNTAHPITLEDLQALLQSQPSYLVDYSTFEKLASYQGKAYGVFRTGTKFSDYHIGDILFEKECLFVTDEAAYNAWVKNGRAHEMSIPAFELAHYNDPAMQAWELDTSGTMDDFSFISDYFNRISITHATTDIVEYLADTKQHASPITLNEVVLYDDLPFTPLAQVEDLLLSALNHWDEVVTARSFTGIFSTDFQPNLVTGA